MLYVILVPAPNTSMLDGEVTYELLCHGVPNRGWPRIRGPLDRSASSFFLQLQITLHYLQLGAISCFKIHPRIQEEDPRINKQSSRVHILIAFDGSTHKLMVTLELLFPKRLMLLLVHNSCLFQLDITQLRDGSWFGF